MDSTPEQLRFASIPGCTIRADFAGGGLSSDLGPLLLKGVDHQIGLTERACAAINDTRHPGYITHSLHDILKQRIYQIASGYEDGIVALVARLLVDGQPLDVYVTHLYASSGEDSLRFYQVQQLLDWIDSRADLSVRIVCGDFNAALDKPSAALMATRFTPSQSAPTAPTPLADSDGNVTHPGRPRMSQCIDYIWMSGAMRAVQSVVCFNRPSPVDATLWPSDHAGVWADIDMA